jgi:hypothetical protein
VTASVNFLRRSPLVDEAEPAEIEHRYFIQLPEGGRITVNGRTYVNSVDVAVDDISTLLPFIIGPLNRYTIIELLSQPIFFFRERHDLDFKTILRGGAKNILISEDEMARRDSHGNVDIGSVTITWTPQHASASRPPPESEYDDDWTANGELIQDPQDYLREQLYAPTRDRYQEIFSSVLLSINDRQFPQAGLSVRSGEVALNPGRTFIVPLLIPEGHHHVLLVSRLQANRNITLYVLDPMAWRITREIRIAVHEAARQLLVESDWWRTAFNTSDDMLGRFPESSHWIDCAQDVDHHELDMFTILNAWALAMGLELIPSFSLKEAPNAFSNQSQIMFDLALQNQLHWKILYAFLISQAYARLPETEEANVIPSQSRRFDMRVRSVPDSIVRQQAHDETKVAMLDETDIVNATQEVALKTGTGRAHTDVFPLDGMSVDLREETVCPRALRGEWRLDSTEEEISQPPRGINVPTQKSASLPQTQPPDPGLGSSQDTSPSDQKAFEIPKVDENDVSENFNPCDHFRKTINALFADHSIHSRDATLPIEEPLGTKVAFHTIAMVVRAMNECLPAGRGFTLTGPDNQKACSLVPCGPRAHDRFALHLQPFGNRTLLLLIDFKNLEADGNTVVHVIGSEPGTIKLTQRRQFYNELRKTWHIFDTPIPDSLRWNMGPRQTAAWQSSYFAVLNAWSILLGLQLNTTGFFPSDSFSNDARQLLEAVNGGHADWRLIWAFLRCTSYVTEQNAPKPGRRFTRTISEKQVKQHEDRLRRKHAQDTTLPEDEHSDTYIPKDSGYPHSTPSLWDDFDDEDVHTRIPELIRSGRYESNLSRSEIRNFYACVYLRAELDKMLGNKTLRADLEDFRAREIVIVEFAEWLDYEDLSLAVATVTLGITDQQPASLGFGFLTHNNIVLCDREENIHEIPDTIRPGRPMLLPVHIADHYILLIIQINDDKVPEFSVMDSKAYHLDHERRQEVHDLATRIVMGSRWWRKDFTVNEMRANLPRQTRWLQTSQQPKAFECGYYVVMNAWSLALGLEPNVDAHIDWNDQFFQDLLDVMHFARMGRLNWLMIYAFLRCSGFVRDSVVPENRRFQNTIEIRSSATLNEILPILGFGDLSEHKSRDCNRLKLPPQLRAHNDTFPSETWKGDYLYHVEELARKRKPHLDYNAKALRLAATTSRQAASREILDDLCVNYPQLQGRDQILRACRSFLRDRYTGRELQLEAAPCDMTEDAISLYRALFGDKDLKDEFRNKDYEDSPWNESMDQIEVNLSLSAVVEAIDSLQSKNHPDRSSPIIFAGGLALSTASNNAMALAEGFTGAGKASRPRRAFLMTLCINKVLIPELKVESLAGTAHHMLVAVQENPKTLKYDLFFYDSAQRIFSESYPVLITRVRNALQNLGWSTHRLEGRTLGFGTAVAENVVQQKEGCGWACGVHTVINGWILAMGLIPSNSATYDGTLYSDSEPLQRPPSSGC